jgi:signal peptidase I
MPLKHIILQRLLLSIYLLIGLLIPGSSLLLANKNKWAFGTPLLGVMWVSLLSCTRWVITPTGFMVMLVGLLVLHLFSYALGLKIGIKQNDITPSLKTWGAFVLLCLLNIGIVVSCHLYKDKWFGFAIYHIPSESMSPTLQTGDIAFIDTWAYQERSPQINDILIVKRSANSMVLVKRLTKIRTDKNQMELFIEGDNQNRSVDSRRFGWVSDDYLIGKVKFVWFSFRGFGRHLEETK